MEVFPFEIPFLDRSLQEQRLNQKGRVIWFTGLSGSGKSTLALALAKKLIDMGMFVQILDGDNIRNGINSDLKFSEQDRCENIRRIAEIAKLFLDSGMIVICCTISPMDAYRDLAREIIDVRDIIEYFVSTPLAICEERDVKGLYSKARSGALQNFSGINAVFELPESPHITYLINSEPSDIQKNIDIIWKSIFG